MTPDALVRNRLASVPALLQLVGEGSITCGGELPRGESFPVITCILDDDIEEKVLEGSGGISQAQVRVEIYAQDDLEAGVVGLARAKAIAAEVTKAVDYYRGPVGDDEVELIIRESIADIEKDTETDLYGVGLLLTVWHR